MSISKNIKILAGTLSFLGIGIGAAVATQKNFDKKINLSDKYLNEAKQYVLENLEGTITSSYIYNDEDDNTKGSIHLTKDNHDYKYNFVVQDNSVVFV